MPSSLWGNHDEELGVCRDVKSVKVSKEGLELSELRIESQLLHRLHNQIPSSAHSSVVRGHVEFLRLLEG